MELDCKSPPAEMRTPFSRFPQRAFVGVEHCSTPFHHGVSILAVHLPLNLEGRVELFVIPSAARNLLSRPPLILRGPTPQGGVGHIPSTRKAPVIPSGVRGARYAFPSRAFCARNPSSIPSRPAQHCHPERSEGVDSHFKSNSEEKISA